MYVKLVLLIMTTHLLESKGSHLQDVVVTGKVLPIESDDSQSEEEVNCTRNI